MVLAALIARLILVVWVFRDQTDPTDHHAQFGWEMGWVARSIVLGRGFSSPFFPATGPTALVPPLFPYLVAGMFRLFGLYTAGAALAILSINGLFSALTCIPIYLSARYAVGQRVAMLAGWGWVVYPYAIYFSAARVWDYALTGLLFSTCFYFVLRLPRQRSAWVWLGFGLLYGFTALANPSVLPMFPIFLALAAVQMRRDGGRWLRAGAAAVVGVAMMLVPWTVHTYRALHVVRPVRDNFWMECWAGNNGDTFESNAVWAHPASNSIEMQRFETLGEIGYLAEKQELAVNFIRQHPAFFAGLSLRRGFCYWTGFWSFNPGYLHQEPLEIPDLFFCSGLTVLMLLGARRFWQRDRMGSLPYLALIMFFPVTYYFTHASPDYRQPIEPEIIVLAMMGALALRKTAGPEEVMDEMAEEESESTVPTTA
jgi:4-amino-4-deoxy-L-arabinose transferase-like glycosyltransferase